jgi:hypothetical protein
MESANQNMPWDCPDSFGKSTFNTKPGQAHLCQWPLKVDLISPIAPYFHKAHLLISADCAAFSYRNFHSALLKGKVLIIGCPEVGSAEFSTRILNIVKLNDILSVTLVRMDAPCCKQFTDAVFNAIKNSKKDIPLQLVTIFSEGEIVP